MALLYLFVFIFLLVFVLCFLISAFQFLRDLSSCSELRKELKLTVNKLKKQLDLDVKSEEVQDVQSNS